MFLHNEKDRNKYVIFVWVKNNWLLYKRGFQLIAMLIEAKNCLAKHMALFTTITLSKCFYLFLQG